MTSEKAERLIKSPKKVPKGGLSIEDASRIREKTQKVGLLDDVNREWDSQENTIDVCDQPKQKSDPEILEFWKGSFIKGVIIAGSIIFVLSVFVYAAQLRSGNVRSLKEYNEWRTIKKISASYKSEIDIAQKVLVFPAQYDQPSKYWKNFFAIKNNHELDELFYMLKVWDLEHDLKRLDLRDSYPVYSKSKTEDRNSIVLKGCIPILSQLSKSQKQCYRASVSRIA